MTYNEFNEKYKHYLEKGFENQGLSFDTPEVTAFLDKVFQDFVKISGFQFSQIKLKFGMPRFYSTLGATLGYLVEAEIDRIIKRNDLNEKIKTVS
jgi:hypothetical protein